MCRHSVWFVSLYQLVGAKPKLCQKASLIIALRIHLIILYIITEENNLPIKTLMAAI